MATAIRTYPDSATLHQLRGRMLLDASQPAEAERELRHVLARRPDRLEAKALLGLALAAQGRAREAIDEFAPVWRKAPGSVEPALCLGWIEATAEADSLRNAERSLAIARQLAAASDFADPRALDLLAAANAEAGQFDEAQRWATQAQRLARDRGDRALADEIGRRLTAYRKHQPWRQKAWRVPAGKS
jgi:Flp pilus assembly protein TadD